MLVKDSNLFQESKRPDNGEPYEFKWQFDPKSKEYHHLKAQMQAFSNISPPAYDEEAEEHQKEEKQKASKK